MDLEKQPERCGPVKFEGVNEFVYNHDGRWTMLNRFSTTDSLTKVKEKNPDDSHVECTPNRWKYGGLMVSQGAKVWVNEYSMKSSKKELSEVRLLPIRRR